MQTRKNTSSPCDKLSLERRWGHPLISFLGGVGFCISYVVIAIGVITVVLLTWFGLQLDGGWAVVAPAAMIVFGYAMLFAFAGWIARSNR